MRFKIDENLPAEIAEMLLARGHAADTVTQEELSGASSWKPQERRAGSF
jgi:hypothetical protein